MRSRGDAVHDERRPQERRPRALEEVRGARELERGTCASMQNAERVQRAVRGMNAGEREPMIPGHLPGHRGDRYLFHGESRSGERTERAAGRPQTSLRRSLLAMRAIAHRSGARESVDFRSRAMTVSSGPRPVRDRLTPRPDPPSRASAYLPAHSCSISDRCGRCGPVAPRIGGPGARPGRARATAKTPPRRLWARSVCGSRTTGIAIVASASATTRRTMSTSSIARPRSGSSSECSSAFP